ncbi:MAG: deoxyribonuclease IV [Chloroherpetonaceae bacterium]|nr:deoxyribonuclease IV [Chthonomonadaceae bacterium]MDW8206698.1 deoxyribonuclease IV [Chloroherpetonaceae bacterium]
MTPEHTALQRPMGAHMPVSGGLHTSLIAGKAIGCTAVQLFTANPRQWQNAPLSGDAVRAFREAQEATGVRFVCAHASYLINLAAANEVLERSRDAFRAELERARQLEIPWVVVHPGAHAGQREDDAMAHLIESLQRILEETDAQHNPVGIALETTAGQGSTLGWRFEQIGAVLQALGKHPRLGACMDTCHIFAAGYDLRDAASYAATMAAFDAHIGIEHLKVIHANDSKKPLGSRVDRHAHIGAGEIGAQGFVPLLQDARLASVPVLLETPEARKMHAINLQRLRCLADGQPLEVQVTVLFFGHYRDYYPAPCVLMVPYGATVRELAEQLAAQDVRLSDLLQYCRFAMDTEYVTPDSALVSDCELAVLPPVSGG